MRSRQTLPSLWTADSAISPEDSLRLREEQLRLSLKAAGQGLFDLDLTTGDADVSPEYAAMIGHDPATFRESYRTWTERLHPDDHQAIRGMLAACLAGRIPHYETEFRQRTRDGQWLWTLSIGRVVSWDADGRPLRMLGTHTNIDTRKRAELALSRSEASLRALFEQAAVGMLSGDVHGEVLEANDYVCQMLGYSLEELRAIGQAGVTHPDDLAEDVALFARLVAGELPYYRLEKRYVRKDGSIVWGDLTVTSHRDHAPPVTVFAILKDITARKEAETALRASEARLTEAQRIAKIGSWDIDHTTGQQWWSDEVFRIFGLEPGSVPPGQAIAKEAIHPDDRVGVEHALVESIRHGKPFQFTHRLRLPDGRITYVEAQGYTHMGSDGLPLHTRATLQDVTERVHADEAIRASLREKDVLLREIHHRVKNNMQTMSSLLQFHAGKVQGPDAARVFGDIHQRLRAMTLVHEKLYASKNLADVDFADYIESLVADVGRPDGRGTCISCTTATIPLRLPVGMALPAGMALVELLTNVFKHAFEGRAHGQASVQVGCTDGQISIIVADDGVGMPPGFEPRSTDSFGWRLIHSLAQQLNGTYAIECGAGTRVTLSFPIGQAAG
jgi:PAS domain S-box-containing protein